MIWPMSDTNQPKLRIYLDYAAATPLSPKVLSAMLPYLGGIFGNPSAIHQEGQLAKQAVAEARVKIARTLRAREEEVIFTGSGTESNNLAILGHVEALHQAGRAYETMEVVTTQIEHPSILALVPVLESKGVRVKFVEVDEAGLILKTSLLSTLSKDTVLVALAYANSEIGTIQPVLRLVKQIKEHAKSAGTNIVVHLDAAQAPLWLPCQVAQLGVDLMALDAGKCNGPKGVGVLYVHHNTKLSPIFSGGDQERKLRPGTENVAGIVGAGEAIALAQLEYKKVSEDIAKLRDLAIDYLNKNLPEAIINGAVEESRLANNINFSLPGFDTEYAVVWLDAKGVAASTKSACAGAGGGISHVVLTCTGDDSRAGSTIRFTFGQDTKLEEVKYAIDCLKNFCEKMKNLTS